MSNKISEADERHLAALFGEAWDNGAVNRKRARKWWKVSLEIHFRKIMARKRTETDIGDEFSEKMTRRMVRIK